MRDYSFISLYKEIHNSTGYDKNYTEFRVGLKSLSAIMMRRIKEAHRYIEQSDLPGAEAISIDHVRNVVCNLLRMVYCGLGIDPIRDLGIDHSSYDDTIQQLADDFSGMNAHNFRATMRFFNSLIPVANSILFPQSFKKLMEKQLSTKSLEQISRREWWIVRLLMFGDRELRCYRNRVYFKKDGKNPLSDLSDPSLVTIVNGNRAVIPNIFNHRDYVYEKYLAATFPKNLFKLRVIQRLLSEDCPNKTDRINSLIQWYMDTFSYTINDLRFEIREMIYNGLLLPECPPLFKKDVNLNNANYKVSLSRLGERILNNLIWRSIYYEVAVDDTPIQEDYCTSEMEPRADYHYPGKSRTDYIIKKTRTMIWFLFYLERVEAEEFSNYIKDKKVFKYQQPDLIFSEKMKNVFFESIKNYVQGYLTFTPRTKDEINNFIGEWCDAFSIKEADRKDLFV